jgi:hypothetical protein
VFIKTEEDEMDKSEEIEVVQNLINKLKQLPQIF